MMTFGANWGGPDYPFVFTDPTQGCLAPRALVPWAIIMLFTIVTAGTIAMGIYWIVLVIQVRHSRDLCTAAYISAIEMSTPNGLFTWMLQAIKLVGNNRQLSCTNLKQWYLGPDTQLQTVRLQDFRNEDMPDELSRYSGKA